MTGSLGDEDEGGRRVLARAALLVAAAGLIAACGDATAPAAACGDLPYFTALPVLASEIKVTTAIGNLGAPGHTLPTDHVGLYLNHEDVQVFAPGDVDVTQLRRTTYVTSPTRQGETDFTIDFRACREVEGWYGHVTALTDAFPANPGWRDCNTYSTSDETVQTCIARPAGIRLTAGQHVGFAGMNAAALALDFGLLDSRVHHFYVSEWRIPPPSRRAVCPYEYFDAASQATLFGLMRDAYFPASFPAGTPRCGAMEVDVANTAQGIWAEQGVTSAVAGNETQYITLANDPYRPQERLGLSLGPATLGATVGITQRQTSGRVNRAFSDVGPDGLIYCYSRLNQPMTSSWFISLSVSNMLTIRRVAHAVGASPCGNDPSTWSFGANTLTLVR